MVGQHGFDHILQGGGDIQLGGGKVGMAQDPLNVGERHVGVAGHPVGSGMAQVVQGPVRPQGGVCPTEHGPGRVVGQRPQRTPQGPPQGLVPALGSQAVQARLVEAKPHEGIRRGRDLLQRPSPLSTDRDQLAPGIDIGSRGPQQLGCPSAGGDPAGHQGPVAVGGQAGEQFVGVNIIWQRQRIVQFLQVTHYWAPIFGIDPGSLPIPY